ncbi:MAG: YdcF family protein [Oligoflexia bacterium]|nr:YdcF family protein [Oligoflexia bacterium]
MRRIFLHRIKPIFYHLGFLLLGLVVGISILPLILAGEIYDYQDTVDGVHLPDVDALVCLAGGRGRIAAAGDLWYRYWEHDQHEKPAKTPPYLYISGMGPGSTWKALGKQLRTGVRDVIRPENVIMETESQNTEANAYWLATYAKKYGWSRILLVTSRYHMKRAQLIFERTLKHEGLKVDVDTLTAFQEPFEPNEWRSSLHGIHVTIQEYLKWVYYKYLWKDA